MNAFGAGERDIRFSFACRITRVFIIIILRRLCLQKSGEYVIIKARLREGQTRAHV